MSTLLEWRVELAIIMTREMLSKETLGFWAEIFYIIAPCELPIALSFQFSSLIKGEVTEEESG